MDGSTIDLGRRGFLTGRRKSLPDSIRPPWSREASIAAACTGCGACVPACPQHIITLDRDSRPALAFETAECSFCGACAQACPEPVFDLAIAAFPHGVAIGTQCFAQRGIVCQSCGDACPESAIRFRPRLGGPALPEVAADRCSGCGACFAACPASAMSTTARSMEAAHV